MRSRETEATIRVDSNGSEDDRLGSVDTGEIRIAGVAHVIVVMEDSGSEMDRIRLRQFSLVGIVMLGPEFGCVFSDLH